MTAAFVIEGTQVENIVDIIGDVVAAVRAEYDPTDNEKPFYMHGPPLEIIEVLKERTQNDELKFKKYPAIVLLEDFKAKSAEGLFSSQAKLNLVIITDTSKYYKADTRYQQSFNAILTPLYDLFYKHLRRSRRVQKTRREIAHDKINHLQWGKKGLFGSEGKMGVDFIDAIEVKDLDIKVYRN